jgi:uncharacterized protein
MSEHEQVSPPPPPPPPESNSTIPSAEEKQWAMFAHLSVLLGLLLTSVFGGWGSFLGPLIIWLIKKDTMPFAANHAKEALNFNIMVSVILFLLVVFTFVTFGLGVLLAMPAALIIGLVALVLTIIAAIKANDGLDYRYPLTIRIIK